jgi:hypothetical protein
VEHLNQEVRCFVIFEDEQLPRRQWRDFRFKIITLFDLPYKVCARFKRDHFYQVLVCCHRPLPGLTLALWALALVGPFSHMIPQLGQGWPRFCHSLFIWAENPLSFNIYLVVSLLWHAYRSGRAVGASEFCIKLYKNAPVKDAPLLLVDGDPDVHEFERTPSPFLKSLPNPPFG